VNAVGGVAAHAPTPPRATIRGRLVLLVLAVAVPLLGLAALAVWAAYDSERDRAEERLEGRARAMAVLVDREIGRAEALLRTAARSDTFRSGNPEAFLADAGAIGIELGGAWVGTTAQSEPARSAIVWSHGTPTPGEEGENTVGRALLTGRTAVSGLIHDHRAETPEPIIVVAVPVTEVEPGGLPGRVLAAAIPAMSLVAVLAELDLPSGWIATLIDPSGLIAARTFRPEHTIGRRATDPVMEALANEPGSTGVVRAVPLFEGGRSFAAFARVPRTGYSAYILVPEEVFTAPQWAALAGTVAIGAVLAALGLALAFLFARQITRALERLLQPAAATPAWTSGYREVDEVAGRLARSAAEREAAEAALRESEARYRSIFDTAVDAIAVIDDQGVIQSINRALTETFGYTAGETAGRNVAVLMGPGDAAGHDASIAHHLSTGERRIIGIGRRVRGRRRDGSAFPLDLSIAEWRDDGGRRFFTGIMRDATEAERAESALRASEARFRALFEASPAASYVTEPDSLSILDCNAAATRMLGYDKAELGRMTLPDIDAGQDGTHIRRRAAAIGAEDAHQFETRHRTSSGELRDVIISAMPVELDGRQLFYSVVVDVTDQRRAEAALVEGERRYRFMAEAFPQIVWTARPDGGLDYLNRRFTQITGLAAEAGLADAWTGVMHPDDLPKVAAAWTHSVATGEPYRVEHRARVADGSWRWFRNSAVALKDEDGRVEMWVGTTADFHDERMAFEEIRRLNAALERRVEERTAQLERVNGQLADANGELEAFAYSVAHDLRAPLRGMTGFSKALLEDHSDRLDDTGRDYAVRISKSAAHLDDLINDLLAYSRLAREEIRPEPVNLEGVVSGVLRQLEPELGPALSAVTVERPLPVLRGHGAVLTQVLGNLIGNALKFVPRGTEPLVTVRAEDRGAAARIWVEDNGIGIRPEHHERVFRVFERLHGRKAYPGTGIGLAIVKKGIERLGGTVGLESEPGGGSRFWFELPVVGKTDA
jgi:PAS domain S-box-containing protein